MKRFIVGLGIIAWMGVPAFAEYSVITDPDTGKTVPVVVVGIANHTGSVTRPGDILVVPMEQILEWNEGKNPRFRIVPIAQERIQSVSPGDFDKAAQQENPYPDAWIDVRFPVASPNLKMKPSLLASFFTHAIGGTEILRTRFEAKRTAAREPSPIHVVPRPPSHYLAHVSEDGKVRSPVLLVGFEHEKGTAIVVPAKSASLVLAGETLKVPVHDVPFKDLALVSPSEWSKFPDKPALPGTPELVYLPSGLLQPNGTPTSVTASAEDVLLPWVRANRAASGKPGSLAAPSQAKPWPFFDYTVVQLAEGADLNPMKTLQFGGTTVTPLLIISHQKDGMWVVTRKDLEEAIKDGKISSLTLRQLPLRGGYFGPTTKLAESSDLPPNEDAAVRLEIDFQFSSSDPFSNVDEANRLIEAVRSTWGPNAGPAPLVRTTSVPPQADLDPAKSPFPLTPDQAHRFLFTDLAPFAGAREILERAQNDPELRKEILKRLSECSHCKWEPLAERGNRFRQNYFGQLAADFPAHTGKLGYLIDPNREILQEWQRFLLAQEEIGEEKVPDYEIRTQERSRIVKEKGLPDNVTEEELRLGFRIDRSIVVTQAHHVVPRLIAELRTAGHGEAADRLDAAIGPGEPMATTATVERALQDGKGNLADFFRNHPQFQKYQSSFEGETISSLQEVQPYIRHFPPGIGDLFTRRVAFREGEQRQKRTKNPKHAENGYRQWKVGMGENVANLRAEHLKSTLAFLLSTLREKQPSTGLKGAPIDQKTLQDLDFRILPGSEVIGQDLASLDVAVAKLGLSRQERLERWKHLPQNLLDWFQINDSLTIVGLDKNNGEGWYANSSDVVEISFEGETQRVPLNRFYELILRGSQSAQLKGSGGMSTQQMRVFLREAVHRDHQLADWQSFFQDPRHAAESLAKMKKRLDAKVEADRQPSPDPSLTQAIRQRDLVHQPEDAVSGAEWEGYRQGVQTWLRRDLKADHLGRPTVDAPDVKRPSQREPLLRRTWDRVTSAGRNLGASSKQHWKKIAAVTSLLGALGLGVANHEPIGEFLRQHLPSKPASGPVLPGLGSPDAVLRIGQEGPPTNGLNQGKPVRYFELHSERSLTELPQRFNFPREGDLARIQDTIEVKEPKGGLTYRQTSTGKVEVSHGVMAIPYAPGFAPTKMTIPGIDPSEYSMKTDPLHQFVVIAFHSPQSHNGNRYGFEVTWEADSSFKAPSQAAEFEGLDREVIIQFVKELRREGMENLAEQIEKHTQLDNRKYRIHLLDIDRAFKESGMYSDRDPTTQIKLGGRFSEFRKYLDGQVMKYICGPANCLEKTFGSEYFKETGEVQVIVENQHTFLRDPESGTVTSKDSHLHTLVRLADNSAALQLDGTPLEMDPETAKKLGRQPAATPPETQKKATPPASTGENQRLLLEALFRLHGIWNEADPTRRKVKLVVVKDDPDGPPETEDKGPEEEERQPHPETRELAEEQGPKKRERVVRQEIELERIIPDGVSEDVHLQRMRGLKDRRLEMAAQLEKEITRAQLGKFPQFDRLREANTLLSRFASREFSFAELKEALHSIYPNAGFDQISEPSQLGAAIRRIPEEHEKFLERFEWRDPRVRKEKGYLKRATRPLDLYVEYLATVDWSPVDSRWAQPYDCFASFKSLTY